MASVKKKKQCKESGRIARRSGVEEGKIKSDPHEIGKERLPTSASERAREDGDGARATHSEFIALPPPHHHTSNNTPGTAGAALACTLLSSTVSDC